nr:MAG TPA: Minor structural protein 4 [Caudoviricetes sp.]
MSNDNTGSIYSGIKTATTTRLRVKDVFSVSGNVTISAGASTNSSKEDLNFYYVLFDVNKKEISNSSTWQSLTSAKIINCGDAKYMAIILRWGSATTMMNPSDISQIRLKIERGTSATPFTLAPEDVNGKIVNVETIANQTAKKFEWIVKGGDSSSNFTLTDRVADLVAERINFKGLVTFSGLNTDAKNEIGKVAQSKVDGLEIGGRNLIINSNLSRTLTNVTNDGCSNMTVVSDSVYGHALKFTAVNQRRVFWATSNVWVKNKTYTVSFVAKSSVTGQKIRPSRSTADWGDDITLTTSYARYTTKITSLDTNAGGTLSFSCTNAVGDITITNVKLEVGNKATDWTPAPEDVSQDATNKASQALTDAKNYSSNAVNWVTNNGSSTTSLNSMVKKWTDGAVSDTAQINGGWIKANTITASKIALADFTNYSQLTRDTADAYGFTVTDDTDGTWFSTKNIKRDQFISEIFPCNGGESYLIEYDISTNAKGANNSTDTKNYIGVAIGVYGYTGTVGSNGLPNKATNIWYADRITGSETAPSIHVKTTITTSTATKQFRVFLQSNGYYFEGTTKIRNLSVRRMYGGTLIVDGSITADKIATDAIKSRNYISSGGTQGSFLNLSDGSFQSPNLSWDSNGNLIASNANLSGLINATKGTVGGWNIATNGLYSGIDENAIKIYSATTYDAQTMYQKQKIQDSFILSQKYINHFVSQQVSVGHNIPYWQTRSFIYNDSQIQLAQSDYCINTSSASNYDAQYSLKDGYISATRIYMEQNITQVGGDVINSSFSIGLDSMMGWCSIQSTKGINIYGNSSRALYVQSNDTSKYNALETEGDVVVNGKIHAVSGDNKIQLNSDNNGSIELYGNTPFIDFHSAYSSADYTCRIIANTPEQLLVCGKLRCDSNIISNNDLIANSWVYAGQNAHYTWQNQLDCYFSCGYYNNTNNVYYYAGYHAFYVNNDSGSGMMYINTNGVTSRVGFTKTSDERIKKNFESFDDNIIDAYMNIEPVKYQLKQSSNDNYHFGFKAQHVDKVFSDYGDTYNESFDICTSRPIDPDKAKELYGVDDMTEEYGLRYDELIAPTTYMVQHIYKELESTKGELAKVKQEKADLETRLQAIEAKLRL